MDGPNGATKRTMYRPCLRAGVRRKTKAIGFLRCKLVGKPAHSCYWGRRGPQITRPRLRRTTSRRRRSLLNQIIDTSMAYLHFICSSI